MNEPTASAFTRTELLACVEREIKMRERVYPQWIQLGRISAAKARHEIAAMKAVRVELELRLPPDPPPPQRGLFG